MRHPGSGNFKDLLLSQLLDHLLNVRRSYGFTTTASPVEEIQKEILKHFPNLMEKQLGVSIGRFGSVFTVFYITEFKPIRLENRTEPNLFGSVRFFRFFG